jgi:exonuclease VII large subunit
MGGVAREGAPVQVTVVLRVLTARFPAVEVVLSPCLVQGEAASAQIVAALRRLDGARGVDGRHAG